MYAHQDVDSALFNASYAAGAAGIVIAGVGAGGISATGSAAAESLFNATGIPIVASHRSADGFVPGADESFMVAGGFYNPQKARVLLQLALTQKYNYEEIKDLFAKSYPKH